MPDKSPSEGALRLAESLLKQGELSRARAVFLDSRISRAGNFQAQFLWAKLLRSQSRFDAAASAFQRSAALEPANLEVYLFWAETLLSGGRFREISAVLRLADKKFRRRENEGVPELMQRLRLAVWRFDFEETARIGELILDRTRGFNDLSDLYRIGFNRQYNSDDRPAPFLREALKALDRYILRFPGSPWGYFYRGFLSQYDPQRRAESAAFFERARLFPAARYGWMRYKTGQSRLYRHDFRGALEDFRVAVSATRPRHWLAQCFMGEARLCLGDPAGAWREFEKARAMVSGEEVCAVLAWKGAALLWAGEYRAADAVLDASLRGGARYAYCWKGATLVMLGRFEPALSWLDRAIAMEPEDVEARVWRAEALLRLRRFKEAADEARRARPGRPLNFYVSVVGGLAKAGMGDWSGLRRDFKTLPPDLVARAAGKLKPADKDGNRGMLGLCEAVLARSRGVRRGLYEHRVWTG